MIEKKGDLFIYNELMSVYDKDYFEKTNYKNYTRGIYRAWHWIRYLALGMWLKMSGCRRVLDFGCADGISVASFRMLGIEAWGCDISEYAISKAPTWIKRFIWIGDLEGKRFDKKYFDCIVSFDVLEHIPPSTLEKTINKIRTLSKHALLGIYVTDELVARIHRLIGKNHPDHLSEHDFDWWVKFFAKQGLNIHKFPFTRKGTIVLDF